MPRRSLQRLGLGAGSGGSRRGDDAENDRRHDLRGHDSNHGLGDTVVRADREAGHAEPHGRGEQPRPHVVAAAKDERRAGHALGALEQRQRRGDEEWHGEAGAVEDLVRDRREATSASPDSTPPAPDASAWPNSRRQLSPTRPSCSRSRI
jgi:hypothetical protein